MGVAFRPRLRFRFRFRFKFRSPWQQRRCCDAMRCDVALGVPSVLADAVQGAGWHGEAGRVSAELGWKWKGAVQ